MNKLKEEFNEKFVKPKLMSGENKGPFEREIIKLENLSIMIHHSDIFDWINQNYISREKVEGLKMEIEKVLEYKPRKNDSHQLRIILGFKSISDIVNINNSIEGVLK